MIKGYVIFNKNGQRLTRNKTWISIEYSQGWVYSKEEIAKIMHESFNWELKPTAYQLAIAHPDEKGVELIGEQFSWFSLYKLQGEDHE